MYFIFLIVYNYTYNYKFCTELKIDFFWNANVDQFTVKFLYLIISILYFIYLRE